MMRVRVMVRDAALLCLAGVAGWWLHDVGTTVLAQRSSASSSARGGDGNLAFQLVGNGPQQSLTVYNAESHTLYVYPHVMEGNAHISCAYSFTITRPGAAIDRQNCPVGELVR
ncbi:MAG TPA: hypothetical protein VGU46_04365 [Acidobacteriaceae bacterium]|nr:hypothetical protein [Acidobacteriaceae bacterium]